MSVKKLATGDKRFFLAISVAILMTLLSGVFLFQNSDSVSSSTTPGHAAVAAPATQNLTGDWTADSNGVKLVATVANNTIKIVLKSDADTSINFWDGTFESQAATGDVIASLKTHTDEIVVSSDQSKTFTIGDGVMTFDMTFMGITKTIHATHI
jgi:hypothetical protein